MTQQRLSRTPRVRREFLETTQINHTQRVTNAWRTVGAPYTAGFTEPSEAFRPALSGHCWELALDDVDGMWADT